MHTYTVCTYMYMHTSACSVHVCVARTSVWLYQMVPGSMPSCAKLVLLSPSKKHSYCSSLPSCNINGFTGEANTLTRLDVLGGISGSATSLDETWTVLLQVTSISHGCQRLCYVACVCMTICVLTFRCLSVCIVWMIVKCPRYKIIIQPSTKDNTKCSQNYVINNELIN